MKKSYLFGILAVLIWSTMAATVKSLLGDIPGFETLASGSFIAFLLLFAVNLFTGKLKLLKTFKAKDFLKLVSLGFLGMFLYSALYYKGLETLSSQEACILNYLWPLMTVIFSSFVLKEKLDAYKIAAMLCSFAGVVIISLGGDGSINAVGIACCIGAAVCYGLFSALNKKTDCDQFVAMMIFWLTVGICSLPAGLVFETWTPVNGTKAFGILWIGIGINAAAYLLWALALKHAKNTASVANLAYLTPFLSLLFSAVLLKEKIAPNTAIAVLLIVGGIVIQSLHGKKSQRRQK